MSVTATAFKATPAASAMVCAMLTRSIDEYDVGEPERVKVVLTVATRAGGVDGGTCGGGEGGGGEGGCGEGGGGDGMGGGGEGEGSQTHRHL